MPRGRRNPAADAEEIDINMAGGRRAVGELVDATAPLPGAIKQVRNQRVEAPAAGNAPKTKELRENYARYLRALRKPEHDMDPAKAIAEVFNLTAQEAEKRCVELHDAMVHAARGISISELMRRYDLGAEARVQILADHARSLDPKVSIVAIKVANDMDDQSKSGGADTFEAWLPLMMGEKPGK